MLCRHLSTLRPAAMPSAKQSVLLLLALRCQHIAWIHKHKGVARLLCLLAPLRGSSMHCLGTLCLLGGCGPAVHMLQRELVQAR